MRRLIFPIATIFVASTLLSACTTPQAKSSNRYSQKAVSLDYTESKTQQASSQNNNSQVVILSPAPEPVTPKVKTTEPLPQPASEPEQIKLSAPKQTIDKPILAAMIKPEKSEEPVTASITEEEGPSLWEDFVTLISPEKVKPWQKAKLAKASMKPGGLIPDSEKFNEKVFSSKESSRGGNGVAGGGCGCN